ncbi:hypothetical protein M513_00918 [Trichuris suis]|uniref:Uncharacterized protein n=1 Tax=Trichuris suis TaxID=68888 RepID=A0A085MLQ9_9BILA|nr:hypothetical protein M513_00918 [Trichuris suis]
MKEYCGRSYHVITMPCRLVKLWAAVRVHYISPAMFRRLPSGAAFVLMLASFLRLRRYMSSGLPSHVELFSLSGDWVKNVTEREIPQVSVHAVIVTQAISEAMNVRWPFSTVKDKESAATLLREEGLLHQERLCSLAVT